MSKGDRRISDERLEAFLDGRLSEKDKADLQAQLAADPEAMRQIELQGQIDDALRRMYSPPKVPPSDVEQLLSADEVPEARPQLPPKPTSRRVLLVGLGALAATIAWGLFVWQWGRRPQLEPYFRPRPLALLYREAVDAGFRPYYFCEDEQRFRLTFAKRQKVPLRLSEMPPERRMVGLSYLGGLSRHTTAMLCYTGKQPIIVFVDRVENDTSIASKTSDPDLHVFRNVLGDLVLYEVTPLESPTIMDFLEIDTTEP